MQIDITAVDGGRASPSITLSDAADLSVASMNMQRAAIAARLVFNGLKERGERMAPENGEADALRACLERAGQALKAIDVLCEVFETSLSRIEEAQRRLGSAAHG